MNNATTTMDDIRNRKYNSAFSPCDYMEDILYVIEEDPKTYNSFISISTWKLIKAITDRYQKDFDEWDKTTTRKTVANVQSNVHPI